MTTDSGTCVRGLLTSGYDNTVRWQPGQRLEHLFEGQCDRLRREGRGDQLAADAGAVMMTYLELDARANQLARFLARSGVRSGDRVGLLFDQPVDSYIGMLAVLKAHATYVPLDAAFPPDRLAYIVDDAAVAVVMTHSWLAERTASLAAETWVVYLDHVGHLVQLETEDRLSWQPGETANDLCYIIYTSGSTGRPKGVAIAHDSICNFVQVAAEVYGITGGDRVYQGMTIAFDFSVEEIWVPWMVGATLVPRPVGPSLLGEELHSFLTSRGVTALCCVPTLLATLGHDLPALRFLLVSGESCPQDLVSRWHRPGRRLLNVYGPTEATVTATWTVLDPRRPVTIGLPLPTYAVVILDPDIDRALPPGMLGEIGIAGVGLARGYLNRPDLTEWAFVPDFIGIEPNPSGRIYRTGDLGRVNDRGEVEHHGRIDAQVKIRGYRIELTEIESALLQVPGIGQAVVSTYEPAPGVVELVGYYTARPDRPAPDASAIYQYLREALPAYMVPSYLERLTAIPMLVSDKADRKSLPAPRGGRMLAGGGQYQAPAAGTQSLLAGLLAETLGVGRVSASSHFFYELGANSLLMARFNAAARQQPGMGTLSIKDVYQFPTVQLLAAAVDARTTAPAQGAKTEFGPADTADLGWADQPGPDRVTLAGPAASQRFFLCGLLQLAAFACYASLVGLALDASFGWVVEGRGVLGVYLRLSLVGAGLLLVAGSLPIVGKWLLIGRWKPQRIPVWSLAYFRFWLVKTLIIASPLARLSIGTPLYGLYLRALGAKVGPGTLVLTRHVPVCTDLLTIGAGSVIRKDTFLNGYRARAGQIETGPITIGAGAFVGEQTVLDINTTIGAGAELGHASALHSGQRIPAAQVWHGCPAEPAGADCRYLKVAPARCGAVRRASYATIRLIVTLAIAGPVAVGLASLQLTHPRLLVRLLPAARQYVTSWTFDLDLLAIAAAILLGAILAAVLAVATVLWLAGRLLRPGRVYPLYGWRYTLQRFIARCTNIPLLTALFGDSSAIVYYLMAVGYRLRPVLQTGSNFGMMVQHEMPTLTAVGTGTMVSDGLSIMNAEFSNSSFRVRPTAIGARNFLGNGIAYPAGGRTGDDCLLATKVMVPIDGPVRTGTGLLGSPCFEIPRTVLRDRRFGQPSRVARRRQLAAKNRHNGVTVALHLLVRYLYVLALLLVAFCPIWAWGWPEFAGTIAAIVSLVAFTVGYFVLVERILTRFHPLRPRLCSIYEPDFWRHERYWKVPATSYIQMFSGTGAKSVIWRMLGVRIGRRVFDDGCMIIERSLVRIGDGCTLNAGSTLQSHSMEDGVFKSDYISIGSGVTVGTAAFVHYGVSMGDDSELDADAFLMKGEHVPAGARWGGNPATDAQPGRRDEPALHGSRIKEAV
jgi:non-ribosomal peptide synthetase-like protein